jgi:hypothetical protein
MRGGNRRGSDGRRDARHRVFSVASKRHPDASVRHIQNLVSAISRPSLGRILLPFSSYKRTYVYVLSKILILYTGSLQNVPIA